MTNADCGNVAVVLTLQIKHIGIVLMTFVTMSQRLVAAAHYPWRSPVTDFSHGLAQESSIYSGGHVAGAASTSQQCGGLVSLLVGVPHYIESPRYPDSYPPNIRCLWEIKAPFGTRIFLYFEQLMLPSNVDCSGDRIEVIDIHYTYRVCFHQQLLQYGTLAPSTSVLFTSDRIREGFAARFRIHVEANRNGHCGQDIAVGGGRDVDATFGEVTTPNFPGLYPTNALCAWRIRSPLDTRLDLRCGTDFWLESSSDCSADFLAISRTGDEAMKDGIRYCGVAGPEVITSESNRLTILFHSNSQHSFGGFRCWYQISGKPSFGFQDSMIDRISSNTVSMATSPWQMSYFTSYPITLPVVSTTASIDAKMDDTWQCDCGVAKKSTREARIVGGTQTRINAYPWIVAIFKREGRQYCAGSLISDHYVLTASHCVVRLRPSDIHVSLGDHDLDIQEETTNYIVKVRRIIVHPGYRSTPVETDDIALLELSQSALVFLKLSSTMQSSSSPSSTVRPICLPRVGLFNPYELTPTVIGWGKLSEAGLSTSVLRETELPIRPNSECQRAYGFSVVTDNMICAGHPEGATDACQGDSGGPMMVVHQSRWHIIGIISYGFGCARPNFPGVYTRIDRYLDWIEQNTLGSTACMQSSVPSVLFSKRQPPVPSTSRINNRYRWPWIFESSLVASQMRTA